MVHLLNCGIIVLSLSLSLSLCCYICETGAVFVIYWIATCTVHDFTSILLRGAKVTLTICNMLDIGRVGESHFDIVLNRDNRNMVLLVQIAK